MNKRIFLYLDISYRNIFGKLWIKQGSMGFLPQDVSKPLKCQCALGISKTGM